MTKLYEEMQVALLLATASFASAPPSEIVKREIVVSIKFRNRSRQIDGCGKHNQKAYIAIITKCRFNFAKERKIAKLPVSMIRRFFFLPSSCHQQCAAPAVIVVPKAEKQLSYSAHFFAPYL